MAKPIVHPHLPVTQRRLADRPRPALGRNRRLRLATTHDNPEPPTLVVISASYRLGNVHGAGYELLSRVAKRHQIASVLPVLTLPRLPHFDHLTSGPSTHGSVEYIDTIFDAADAVLFCVAEYAEALPSIVVNLLEWAIADGFLCGMPTGWLNLATGNRGRAAHAALERALSYAGADVVLRADLPVATADLSPNGRLHDAAVSEQVLRALRQLLPARQPTTDHPSDRRPPTGP